MVHARGKIVRPSTNSSHAGIFVAAALLCALSLTANAQLTTARVSNLLAAGRCISTSRYVHQATKEIPAAMATGEGAGAAAVHALAHDGRVHDVDVDALRRDLARSGAIV